MHKTYHSTEFIQHFLKQHNLHRAGKILLAVSGGIDSMVLLHMFYKAGVEVVVAHCNFTLRGEESDGDEAFVKKVCLDYGLGCHVARMDTSAFAQTQKLSIQEAARMLRYDWFRQLMQKHGYAAVVTAHQATDQVETMLLQITRGTGFKGVQGMSAFHDGVARPLLNWSRKTIESYAQHFRISFREDSSNTSDAYARNLLRHHVLPILERINPAYEEHFLQTSLAVQQLNRWFGTHTQKWVSKHVQSNSRTVRIPIHALLAHKAPLLLLQELLQPFDFGFAVIQQLHTALSAQAGKIFYSRSHRLIKDRDVLLLTRLRDNQQKPAYVIEKNADVLQTPYFNIEVETINHTKDLLQPSYVALLDKDKLHFPLTVRPWAVGDKFRPLGLKGHKKVSDFLTDCKLSLLQKENTWVVESDGHIIWVAGWRIDNRYKITGSTSKVLCIKWHVHEED